MVHKTRGQVQDLSGFAFAFGESKYGQKCLSLCGRTAAVDEALAAHGIPTCLFPMEEVGGF